MGSPNLLEMHIVNVCLHAWTSIKVADSVRLVCKLSGTRVSKTVATAAALLFAVHPIHAEAVAGLVGRADVLCTLAYYHAIMTYAKDCRDGREHSFSSILFCDTFFVSGTLAILSKELGITYPVACLWVDIIGRTVSRRRTAILVVVTALSVSVSIWIRGGMTPPHFSFVDNPIPAQVLQVRLLTAGYVCARYIQLLILPVSMSTDYSFAAIPLVTQLMDVRLLGIISGVLLVVGLIAHGLMNPKSRVVTCCVGLCVIPMLPASHFFIPIGTVIAERLLYLPSVGYCILLAWCLLHRRKKSMMGNVIFAVLLGIYAGRAMHRSADWRTGRLLAVSAYQAYPCSAKALLAMGIERRTGGDAVEPYPTPSP